MLRADSGARWRLDEAALAAAGLDPDEEPGA